MKLFNISVSIEVYIVRLIAHMTENNILMIFVLKRFI